MFYIIRCTDKPGQQDLRLANRPNRTPGQDARLAAAQKAFQEANVREDKLVRALFAKEVIAVTDFIADQANIFAVKPMIMFDASHLGLPDGGEGKMRYGAGGGLQFDVVLARFEFGYVFGFNREPGDKRGNFVGRLTFKRFF